MRGERRADALVEQDRARPASPSTTIVITRSQRSPTSAGEEATSAPCSAAQACAVSAVRFQTTSSKPARRRFAAIREPMIPRPMKPTRSALTGASRRTR